MKEKSSLAQPRTRPAKVRQASPTVPQTMNRRAIPAKPSAPATGLTRYAIAEGIIESNVRESFS